MKTISTSFSIIISLLIISCGKDDETLITEIDKDQIIGSWKLSDLRIENGKNFEILQNGTRVMNSEFSAYGKNFEGKLSFFDQDLSSFENIQTYNNSLWYTIVQTTTFIDKDPITEEIPKGAAIISEWKIEDGKLILYDKFGYVSFIIKKLNASNLILKAKQNTNSTANSGNKQISIADVFYTFTKQ